jgi:hypothetical protein
MEEIHRELLKKRRSYLLENVIMEDGLLLKLREAGLFTNTMVAIIQVSIVFLAIINVLWRSTNFN